MHRLRDRASIRLVLWVMGIAALVMAAAACGGATNGTLLAIDAKTGQELWRVRPPGGALGRPLAADGQVFVTTSSDCNSLRGTLVAYDASAGKEQWRAASGGCFSSAQARQGIVVAPGDKRQRLQGLDAHTGDNRWNTELKERTDLTVIDSDNLVVAVEVAAYDARFRALDRSSGQERWNLEMTLPGRFGPAAATATSAIFLTQPFGGQQGAWPLTALDLETGEQRWAVNVGGLGTYNVGLAVIDNIVVARFGESRFPQGTPAAAPVVGSTYPPEEHFNTIAAFDAVTGQEIWRHQESGDPFASDFAVADNSIYVYGLGGKAANTLTALDVQSGTVLWQINPGDAFREQQTVAAGDGVVVLTLSEESRGRVLAFAATDGSRLWESEVPASPGVVHATSVSAGVVYVSAWGKVPAFGD